MIGLDYRLGKRDILPYEEERIRVGSYLVHE